MKKGRLKKILCAGLALAMAVSLPACGKKKDANSGLAKEHVYKYQEVALPDFGRDYSVMESVRRDGVIYLLVQIYHWNDEGKFEGNRDTDIRVVSMKEDGSDVKEVMLQVPVDSKDSGDFNGGISVMPIARSAVSRPVQAVSRPMQPAAAETTESDTETDTDTEADTDTETGSDTEADMDVPMEEPMTGYVWENTYYNNFSIGADGGIYAIKRYNYSYDDYENPENSVYIRKYYLYAWNADGSFRRETELEGLQTEEEYCYISDYVIDSDGNAILLINGDNAYKMTVDAQGKASERTKLPDNLEKVFNNLDSMLDKGNGEFWVIYRDENDWQKMFLADYNMNTGELGAEKQLPSTFGWQGYNCLKAGICSDLIYSTSSGLYTLNGGDDQSVMKMDYINSDMNIYGFENVVELDENRFMGIFSEAYDNTVRAGIFTYVNPEDIKDKSVLVLAGLWIGSDMKQRVVEFNRSNEEYRIVVKSYEQYNGYGYDNRNGGVTQLNNDIISGSMPDMLITSSGLPADNYAAKGLLADIGQMIEKDEELARVDFMTNVFDAYSMNDKLYYVIPSFRARTMVGKTSIVGDRNTWTIKEMQEVMASLPEGTNLLSELTRDSFFNYAMQYCGSDFVDVEKGKCNFDSEGFIALMEYARTLPEELDEDYFGEDYWMNYESQYRDNRTIISQLYISSLRNINYTINGYFGEPVSYIGFPTESGQGAYVEAVDCYAISSKSKHKDVAWEFLRYYLTDEYQSDGVYSLPIQRKYFMEKAQEATEKPYWIDSEGNKIEYEDTIWMNGESVPIPTMSQEQVDTAIAMIESITKHPYVNEDIMNIVNEEMGAFFSGQKGAKEVAGVIQNRAQLYVDENR